MVDPNDIIFTSNIAVRKTMGAICATISIMEYIKGVKKK